MEAHIVKEFIQHWMIRKLY